MIENEIQSKCPEVFEILKNRVKEANWAEAFSHLEKLGFLAQFDNPEIILNNAIRIIDDSDCGLVIDLTPSLFYLNSLVFSICTDKPRLRNYVDTFLELVNDLSFFKIQTHADVVRLEEKFAKKCFLIHQIFMHIENVFISNTKKTIPQYLNDLFYNFFISGNQDDLNMTVEGREVLKKYPKPRFFYIPYLSKMPQFVNNYFGEVENGKRHGFGMISFLNGDLYKGCFRNGAMNGSGTYYWASGGSYEGEFVNGVLQGHGTEMFESRNVYVGEYFNGKKHGRGEMRFKDGDKYVGEWRFNGMEGEAEYIWSTGVVFKGRFLGDKRQGRGEITMENGTKHEGKWVNNELA